VAVKTYVSEPGQGRCIELAALAHAVHYLLFIASVPILDRFDPESPNGVIPYVSILPWAVLPTHFCTSMFSFSFFLIFIDLHY
jgi:hypothetical protein